jgi:hypothetical protein
MIIDREGLPSYPRRQGTGSLRSRVLAKLTIQPICAKRRWRGGLPGLLLFALPLAAGAQNIAFTDALGNQWRQLTDTTGFGYSEIERVCSVRGSSCIGTLPASSAPSGTNCDANPTSTGCVTFTGWHWATLQQVLTLFEDPAFNIPAMPLPAFNRHTYDESANLSNPWNVSVRPSHL